MFIMILERTTTLKIPEGIRPSKRSIIKEYIFLREAGLESSARTIAVKLGYTLDQNRCNSYVLMVLRDYLRGVA